MAAQPPRRLRLGRETRIKQGRDFSRVRREGQRLTEGCLIVNWQRQGAASGSRVGVITSGKIGGAVVRNRARRILRECFRLHQHELSQPVDLVLVARASIAHKRFSEVQHDFLKSLRRARLLSETAQAK